MKYESPRVTARTAALEMMLREMEDAQLVRRASEAEEAYQFKHAMTQESVYDSLLKSDRKRLHYFVATALEGAPESSTEELVPVLARHWDDAGEMERALTYYLRAGKNAARVFANAEALMAYDRARDLAQKVELSHSQLKELYTGRGRVLELRNAYNQALENYQELQDLGAARGDPQLKLEGLIQHAKIHATPNPLYDLPHAESLALDALEAAKALNDRPAIARVLWNLLLINNFSGEQDQAISFGEASLAIARELNLREQLAYTLNDIVRAFAMTGQKDKARAAWQEADQLWRELNNLPMRADNLTNACLYAFFWGDQAAAVEMAEEGLRLAEETANTWGAAYAQNFLGIMHYVLGDLARAFVLLERGARLGLEAHALDTTADGYSFIALIYRLIGLNGQGIAVLERALELVESHPSFAGSIQGTMTILLAEEGDLPGAREAYGKAQKSLTGNLDSSAAFLAGFGGARLALAEGQPAQAEQMALEMLGQMEQAGIRPFRAMAELIVAQAREQQGDLAGALERLEIARADALETPGRTTEWEVLVNAVRMYEKAGQVELARTRRREALQVTAYLADHAPEGMRQVFLERAEVKALRNQE